MAHQAAGQFVQLQAFCLSFEPCSTRILVVSCLLSYTPERSATCSRQLDYRYYPLRLQNLIAISSLPVTSNASLQVTRYAFVKLNLPIIAFSAHASYQRGTVVPPYVGMVRKQNGGYNASISVQTPILHLVHGVFYASEDTQICCLTLPQLYVTLRVFQTLLKLANLEAVKIQFRHLLFLSFFSQPSALTQAVPRAKQSRIVVKFSWHVHFELSFQRNSNNQTSDFTTTTRLLAKCQMPFYLLRNSTHVMRPYQSRSIMQTYLLARHTALLLSHLCKVADLLLLATGSASLQVWAGLVSSAWAG